MLVIREHTVSNNGDIYSIHGVTARVVTEGQQYSHRTFSRTATGALVGGAIGLPLVGALIAPSKKVDTREPMLIVDGEDFQWCIPIHTFDGKGHTAIRKAYRLAEKINTLSRQPKVIPTGAIAINRAAYLAGQTQREKVT